VSHVRHALIADLVKRQTSCDGVEIEQLVKRMWADRVHIRNDFEYLGVKEAERRLGFHVPLRLMSSGAVEDSADAADYRLWALYVAIFHRAKPPARQSSVVHGRHLA
jgi:hypothetical protein